MITPSPKLKNKTRRKILDSENKPTTNFNEPKSNVKEVQGSFLAVNESSLKQKMKLTNTQKISIQLFSPVKKKEIRQQSKKIHATSGSKQSQIRKSFENSMRSEGKSEKNPMLSSLEGTRIKNFKLDNAVKIKRTQTITSSYGIRTESLKPEREKQTTSSVKECYPDIVKKLYGNVLKGMLNPCSVIKKSNLKLITSKTKQISKPKHKESIKTLNELESKCKFPTVRKHKTNNSNDFTNKVKTIIKTNQMKTSINTLYSSLNNKTQTTQMQTNIHSTANSKLYKPIPLSKVISSTNDKPKHNPTNIQEEKQRKVPFIKKESRFINLLSAHLKECADLFRRNHSRSNGEELHKQKFTAGIEKSFHDANIKHNKSNLSARIIRESLLEDSQERNIKRLIEKHTGGNLNESKYKCNKNLKLSKINCRESRLVNKLNDSFLFSSYNSDFYKDLINNQEEGNVSYDLISLKSNKHNNDSANVSNENHEQNINNNNNNNINDINDNNDINSKTECQFEEIAFNNFEHNKNAKLKNVSYLDVEEDESDNTQQMWLLEISKRD